MASRFQFSIRQMLLAAALVAAAVWVLTSEPTTTSCVTLVFLVMAIPALFSVGLLRTRNYLRTFCIGALFPSYVSFLFTLPTFAAVEGIKDVVELSGELVIALQRPVALLWCCSVITGSLCVVIDLLFFRGTRSRIRHGPAEPRD